jgi:hypothetical protein
VLHAIADENAKGSAVHSDRDFHAHLAEGHGEQEAHLVVETQTVGRSLEIVIDDFAGIVVRRSSDWLHLQQA